MMAHELAHVKHRDILVSSVAATIGAAIMFLAQMAQKPRSSEAGGERSPRGQQPPRPVRDDILAPLAAALIQAATSRSREFGRRRGAQSPRPYGLVNALR